MLLKDRRLPAYPLFVKDPFFSVWSAGDALNETDAVFWHGEKKPMCGYADIDGKRYRFLGRDNGCGGDIQLKQESVELTAFSTIYNFSGEGISLRVEFLSPLPPDDPELASCPVCYLIYSVKTARKFSSCRVGLKVEERIAYNTCFDAERSAAVRTGTLTLKDMRLAWTGLKRQMPLSHSADEFGADWGYWYVAGQAACVSEFNGRKYIGAENTHGNSRAAEGKLLVAFDDTLSVFYFGEWLKGYYFRSGKTIFDAISSGASDFEKIRDKCAAFDERVRALAAPYGQDYLFLLYAALRQSVGAHKLVEDGKGRLLFLSKECNSDGCIATVDISYPSAPLYLLFNPRLVLGMLYPIFDFAEKVVWQKEFAPHDAGIYPYCVGQFYAVRADDPALQITDWKQIESIPHYYAFPAGNKIYDDSKQMPVEECGNMLIMSALLVRESALRSEILRYSALLKKWADYLCKHGLEPENQLCTDDFAGHSNKNGNLAVKAIIGIHAYSLICAYTDKAEAEIYADRAKEFAAKWLEIYGGAEHSVFSPDDKDSFSLKYNMAMDDLLGAGLFPREFKEREVGHYLSKANRFGVPLDSRKKYSKTDWLIWAASLTQNKAKRSKFIKFISDFLTQTPDRVPFSDWFCTETAGYHMFRNRAVQGGLFLLPLF